MRQRYYYTRAFPKVKPQKRFYQKRRRAEAPRPARQDVYKRQAFSISLTVICSFSFSQIWLPPMEQAWADAVTTSS